MEKRVFLAIFLSFIVLAGYQAFFAPPPPVPSSAAPVESGGAAVPQAAGAAGVPGAPVAAGVAGVAGAGAAAVPTSTTPAPQALIADDRERDVVVETDTVRAVFSSKGGALKSWLLFHYKEAGAPHDLIPQGLPETLHRAFSLGTTDPALSARLATALYRPSADGLKLGSGAGSLSFDYQDASGLMARKTFHFQPEGKAYVMNVDAAISMNGASLPMTIHVGPAVGLGYKPDGSRDVPPQVAQMRGADKPQRLHAAAIVEQPRYDGLFRFAGVEEQYFFSAVLPGAQSVQMSYQPITLPVDATPGVSRNFIAYDVTTTGPATLAFFVGPKDLDVLRAVDPQIVRVIDFGMFAFLVVPLLQALKWVQSFVGNWGWSIVVLTVIINLIMFPLRHKSMVSMRKMQALQPEVKAIQERYAKYKLTDPERQKMNTEMMALYKQKGVNPASGCIPMLLTLPVLYAFYNLLYSSIELRGAPFAGWIHDLSLHDPLFITPVLMGATMFWQQWMMPTTADAMQQRIFLLMPLIFTFTFLWMPAGLVLYWLVSNILAIGQQYMTNRMIGAPVRPVPAVARPAVTPKKK